MKGVSYNNMQLADQVSFDIYFWINIVLQKAFILLIKNVDIIKTGFQEKGGIDFSRRFWKS